MDCCFPEVIIFEILIRIPAEDLIRFKTVCKPWYNLISNHKFIKSHLALAAVSDQQEVFSTMYPWMVTEDQYRNKPDLSLFNQTKLPLLALKKHVDLHEDHDYSDRSGNSCNGLILVMYPLILCNPVTRQFESLPYPPPLELDSVFLVHDKSADKFKVFAFYSINHEFYVLTLSKLCWKVDRKRKWKRERKPFNSYDPFSEEDWSVMEKPAIDRNEGWLNYRSNFLVLENEVHWVGTIRSDSYNVNLCEDEPYHLFSMNAATEECKRNKIQIRQDMIGKNCRFYLSELKRLPCLTIILPEHLEIHVLEDNENCQWTTFPRISLVPISNGLVYERNSWISTFVVCKLSSGSGDLRELVQVFIVHEDQVFLYQSKSQDFKLIGYFNRAFSQEFGHLSHFNSLVWWK